MAYFQGALAKDPGRVDLMRVWPIAGARQQAARGGARSGKRSPPAPKAPPTIPSCWRCADPRQPVDKAKATLNSVPPTHETFDRYRLEAMIADSEKNWKKADSFYEIAAGLTEKPAAC